MEVPPDFVKEKKTKNIQAMFLLSGLLNYVCLRAELKQMGRFSALCFQDKFSK